MLQEQLLYEFGPFQLNPTEHRLMRHGREISLSPKAFQVLTILIHHRGRLVPKEDLMKAVWGATCVESGNLTVTISVLRKALGDAGTRRRYIQTVSRVGYRFTGEVSESGVTIPEQAIQPSNPQWFRSRPRVVWTATVSLLLMGLTAGISMRAGTWGRFPGTLAGPGLSPVGIGETSKPAALQAYIAGRYYWARRTQTALKRSIAYFQDAIAEDPTYARAYAGLADASVTLRSANPEESGPELARNAALRAVQLAPSLTDAHAALGLVYFFQDQNWKRAEREFRTAIALDPNSGLAHQRYGLALAALGRFDESYDQMRRAAQADPLSLIIQADVGWGLYLQRRYDEAIAVYQKVIAMDPGFAPAHMFLALASIHKEQYADAIRELEEAQRLGESPSLTGLLGYARVRAGDTAGGQEVLNSLEARSRHEYIPPFSVVLLHIGLGEKDQAIDWLARAYASNNTMAMYAKTDPSLDPLRSDRRFEELMRRVGF